MKGAPKQVEKVASGALLSPFSVPATRVVYNIIYQAS
jgi:hypothetical protein